MRSLVLFAVGCVGVIVGVTLQRIGRVMQGKQVHQASGLHDIPPRPIVFIEHVRNPRDDNGWLANMPEMQEWVDSQDPHRWN